MLRAKGVRRFCCQIREKFDAGKKSNQYAAFRAHGIVLVVAKSGSGRAKELTDLVEKHWLGRVEGDKP